MMPSLKLISEEKMTNMEVILKIAILFTVRGSRKGNNLVNTLDFKVWFYSALIVKKHSLCLNKSLGIFCGFCTMCGVFDIQIINKWMIDFIWRLSFLWYSFLSQLLFLMLATRGQQSQTLIFPKTCWQVPPLDGAVRRIVNSCILYRCF